jgi:prepilin peptidase CpaA
VLIHLQLTLAILAATIAAATDLKCGKIPNWLTLPLTPLALTLSFAMGGWASAKIAFWGLAICGLVPALLYFGSRGKAIGGGDVKLFAGLGTLLGPLLGLETQLYAYVLIAVFALGHLAWSGQLLRTLGNGFALLFNRLLPEKHRRAVAPELLTQVRMGPAILLGCLIPLARNLHLGL